MPQRNLTERLYNLRRDRSSGYEKPYKPALLLSLIDLIERGDIIRNQILLTDDLISRYKDCIAIVGSADDVTKIAYPFWHLAGDGIWVLYDFSGQPLYRPAQEGIGSLSVKRIRESMHHASLDEQLFIALNRPIERNLLRDAIISRYFPKHRDKLRASRADFLQQPEDKADDGGALENDPARSAAFSKTIKCVYDFQCAACGIRLRYQDLNLVDACHLVPFSLSFNDHPSNGVALCKNHHWALDRHLIAPERVAGQLIWKSSKRLDPRTDDQHLLIELEGQPLLLPRDEDFYPADASIEWRMERLLG